MARPKYSKMKNGLYYSFIPTGQIGKNGKPEYKRLTAKTIARLNDKITAEKTMISAGITHDKMTVNEWYAQWFASYKSACKPSTQIFYRRKYEQYIKPAIGNIMLDKVSNAICQKLLTDMANNHAIKTVREVRAILHSIFDTARKNKKILENPACDLIAKGKPKKERRALTEEERIRYLEACKRHPFGTYAAFLYFFGIRKGEALALTGADIYNGAIHINKQLTYPDNGKPVEGTPKTAAGYREIPIPSKAYDYIDFDNLPKGRIFTDEAGNDLGYRRATSLWNSFIASCLPDSDVTIHVLRHNYCMLCFEAGLEPLYVMQLMGHDDARTTLNIYAHYTKEMAANQKDKLLSMG